MREGLSPQAACAYVCQRVIDRHQGAPQMNIKMVALNKAGDYGCCSVRGRIGKDGETEGLGVCIRDPRGLRIEPGEALLPALTLEEQMALPLR